MRLLLIGTFPPPIGGGTVMLQYLADALAARCDVRLTTVDFGGIRKRLLTGPFRLLRVLRRIAAQLRTVDVVVLHATTTALHVTGPVVWALARWRRRPFILRKIAGTDYRDFPWLRRTIVRWVVHRADSYLVESKALVQAAEEDGVKHAVWFPNNRPVDPADGATPTERQPCRRFVFVSQVRPTKGIPEIIAAGEQMGDDVIVDVYGPFYDGLTEKDFADLRRVRYCGVAPPKDVPAVLREYDVLLLPSYWVGEGYPGTLLEAFSAGLPVITTNWRSIPEVVDETSGLLIPPRDSEALRVAMDRLIEDDELYRRLCVGARRRATLFSTEAWAEHLTTLSRRLLGHAGPAESGDRPQ